MRILLVDDSILIAAFVKSITDANNLDLTVAKNGQEAIKIIKSESAFDVIFLDWNMPVMDGPSFLEQNIKDKFASCPIVMLTTENSPDKIERVINLGVSEYIMKAFTEDIFLNKLQMVVGQKAS